MIIYHNFEVWGVRINALAPKFSIPINSAMTKKGDKNIKNMLTKEYNISLFEYLFECMVGSVLASH